MQGVSGIIRVSGNDVTSTISTLTKLPKMEVIMAQNSLSNFLPIPNDSRFKDLTGRVFKRTTFGVIVGSNGTGR